MPVMKQRSAIFTLSATVFVLIMGFAPLWAATISVGNAQVSPGGKAVMPVYLSDNGIEIACLTIPLQFTSPDVSVDSISFVGTLVRPDMDAVAYINNNVQFVRITYLPQSGLPVITEESGLLARIHFSVDPQACGQYVFVDSVHKVEYYGSLALWTRLELTDSTGEVLYFPDFESGLLTVNGPLDAEDDPAGLPITLELKQNCPNPFNPSTVIAYSLPERADVRLTIYNILGQEITTLVDESQPAGEHEVTWQADQVASGIYFYRLTVKGEVLTKKMALLK